MSNNQNTHYQQNIPLFEGIATCQAGTAVPNTGNGGQIAVPQNGGWWTKMRNAVTTPAGITAAFATTAAAGAAGGAYANGAYPRGTSATPSTYSNQAVPGAPNTGTHLIPVTFPGGAQNRAVCAQSGNGQLAGCAPVTAVPVNTQNAAPNTYWQNNQNYGQNMYPNPYQYCQYPQYPAK